MPKDTLWYSGWDISLLCNLLSYLGIKNRRCLRILLESGWSSTKRRRRWSHLKTQTEQWGRCCQKRNTRFRTYGLKEAYQCVPEQWVHNVNGHWCIGKIEQEKDSAGNIAHSQSLGIREWFVLAIAWVEANTILLLRISCLGLCPNF